MTYSKFIPYVGFNLEDVALYVSPEGQQRRQTHLVLQIRRDNTKGENCPNVRLIRKMEAAVLTEMAAQEKQGLRNPVAA